MIIDTSAILAILLEESDADRYMEAIVDGEPRLLSVANWFEIAMVVGGRGKQKADKRFDDLVGWLAIELVAVTFEQARAARDGWRRFGRGNHPARLNYGDCFAYALAKTSGEPLLFKGNDFPQTDIESALKS